MTEPNPHRTTYTREFIDRAVRMAINGRGHGRRDAPSLRPVARELGLPMSTLRNWVHQAAGATGPGQDTPRRLQPRREDRRLPDPPSAVLHAGDRHRGHTDRVAQLSRECERLAQENAALKVVLVVLAQDLGIARDRETPPNR